MSDDFDKREWQAMQEAQNAALEKQREKEKKTRERAARNAKRKLERLKRTLSEDGELSEWEEEFSESVTERLDKYGSAFHDLQKGRPGDALSFAQKRVVSALNKKAKDKKKAARAAKYGNSEDGEDEQPKKSFKKRSSFKSKKPKFKPRVRQLDEDFEAQDLEANKALKEAEAYIPKRKEPAAPQDEPPVKKKPFLRIVKNDD